MIIDILVKNAILRHQQRRFTMQSADTLADELTKLLEQKFDAGLRSDISKVVKEAILKLENDLKIEALRRALQPAIDCADRGEYREYSYEQLMADTDKM